jgi:serine/threonine protein kinase
MKPENILVDGNFHCKISDFGAAKIIDPRKVKEELKNVSFDFDEAASEIDLDPSFDLDSLDGRLG